MASLVAMTFAQDEAAFEMRRQLVASAGQPVTDSQASLRLHGSLGQPLAGSVITTTAYHLNSGYWAVAMVQPPQHIYLPILRK